MSAACRTRAGDGVLVGKVVGHNLEDPGIDGTVISKWNLKKWGVKLWTGLILLMIGQVAGFCAQSNEPLRSTKRRKFLDYLPKTMSFMGRNVLHAVTQHKLAHKLQKPPMDPTFSQPNLYCTSVTLL